MKIEELRKLVKDLPAARTPSQERITQEALQSLGFEPGALYQELEMSSRFVDTHRDTTFSNESVNLHSHTFYEILCCRNTCGAEYLVGANRYRLQKGDIIIIPPGVSHRPLLPEHLEEPYERDVLWISPDFISSMSQTFPDERLFEPTGTRLIRTAGTRWEFLSEKFRQGVKESERRDVGWEAALAANTVQLVVQLRRAILDKNTKALKAEKKDLMDQVLEYVEAHLGEKIKLAEIARHFYVSESTISQLFQKRMGVSFYRCVTQRRLIAAKSMIWEDVPMEEVSRQVGFADYSSFYRAFKQEYGISPRQYRKLQNPAEEE